MITFIKANWKLIAIGVAALLLFVWISQATGVNKKLWDFAWKQINAREQEIITTLENENIKINQERDQILRDLTQVKKDRVLLAGKITELEVKNRELKDKLAHIVIPTTPSELVDRLKSRGFHPRVVPK